jgi:hypothetical protein
VSDDAYGTSTRISDLAPSESVEKITPTPPEPTLCSQSCSQRLRFERISADKSGLVTPSDQDRWISMDVARRACRDPKVPGSRPGRPVTFDLFRGCARLVAPSCECPIATACYCLLLNRAAARSFPSLIRPLWCSQRRIDE